MTREVERIEERLAGKSATEFSVCVVLDDHYEQGRSTISYPRTSTTTFESHYLAGTANAAALSATAHTINTLYAIPFVFNTAMRVEEISTEVQTEAAGAQIRLGIYDATDEARGDPYPNRLVWASGVLAGTVVAVVGESCEVDLEPGRLYFAVYTAGVLAPTIRSPIRGSMIPFQGIDAAFGANPGWGYQVARTFAALPDRFPTGATSSTGATAPGIGLRLMRSSVAEVERSYVAFVAPRDGYVLRRAKFVPADGQTQPGARSVDDALSEQGDNAWAYVRVGRRTGRNQRETFGDFDSRLQQANAWTPFALTGLADISVTLSQNQVLEVSTAQGGWPHVPLRGSLVQLDLAYEGA